MKTKKYLDTNTGMIKDITLEIAESDIKGQFESKANKSSAVFSKEASDGIILSGEDISISLIPRLFDNQANVQNTPSIYARQIDTKTISYDYDEKTSLEYSLTYTGFKEDIVVKEYTGQTEYNFTLLTNGLHLSETNGSYSLLDSKENVKAVIGDIIIFTNDNNNNTVGKIISKTIAENQEYLLTIVVDSNFLASSETAYPIRIDPTIEICYDNNGDGAISDVTINSNSGSSATSGSLFVGLRQTYGISRILMKFPGLDLSSLGNDIIVTNAKVELRDLLCESAELDVYCYVFTGNVWNESTVEWSNVSPNSYSTFLSSNTVSYSNGTQQSVAHWYSFDITAAVEGWRTSNYNQNKGIIFKAPYSIENGNSYINKTFSSYNRTSYRPSLSVTYNFTSNLISNDTYYLNNRYCGDYLRYTSSSPTATSGLISSLGNSIRWEIVSVTGGYIIRSKSDTTKYLAVPSSTSSASVSIVTVSDSSIPTRCKWTITWANGGGCLVKNNYNSRYLYSYGDSLYTASSTGAAGSSTYFSKVWRLASVSYYGNTSNYSARELQSGFSISTFIVNINQSKTPTINKNPSNAIWASSSDFSYSYYTGTSNIVTFNYSNGSAIGQSIGIATYKATHKITNRTYYFTVYVDRYTYELANTFGFSSNDSILIRDLYNRIDSVFSSESSDYKAWHVSRLLSEFSYDNTTYYFGIIGINKWDDVAGSVTSPSNRKDYFTNTLNYTEDEYNSINTALTNQHSNTQTSDFTHMQYSLAARLAYSLDLDGPISNLYGDDEHISYLAGWLGDATLLNNGTTSFGNDDYMADLDAENLYRMIYNTTNSISAINDYYQTLSLGYSGVNRATIFKNQLSYLSVESLVLSELDKTLEEVRTQYPDTYDFLMSLYNNLSQISHY